MLWMGQVLLVLEEGVQLEKAQTILKGFAENTETSKQSPTQVYSFRYERERSS